MSDDEEPAEKGQPKLTGIGNARNELPTDKELEKKVFYVLSTPVFVNFDVNKDPLNNLIMRCESMLFKAPGTLTQNAAYRLKITGFAEVSVFMTRLFLTYSLKSKASCTHACCLRRNTRLRNGGSAVN
jgi:hypothetical protein